MKKIASIIDHTLLKADATDEDIKKTLGIVDDVFRELKYAIS